MKNNSKLNIKNLSLLSIGVATYQLSKSLPNNLKEFLPSTEEIERNLLEFLINDKNRE